MSLPNYSSWSTPTVERAEKGGSKRTSVERAVHVRKKAFDCEARSEIEEKSSPKVPQTATGNFNLDGKNKAERGGDLTKAVLTTEIQLRGGLLSVTERARPVLL